MTTDKFCCPSCGGWKSKVINSRPDTEGTKFMRWRHCDHCEQLFQTAEQATGKIIPLHTPAVTVTVGSTP